MRLGIIQTDPSDPNTFKIVDQERKFELEDVIDYEVKEHASNRGQYLTVTVLIKREYK